MKKKFSLIIAALILTFIIPLTINSQEENIAKACRDYFKVPYIASGQPFKALLTGNEVAEFHTSFFAGTTYRIVACPSGENNIIFSIYDKDRNLIFSNKHHDLSPYWDFNVMGSLDCIVGAQLDSTKSTSGIVMIMVGFKANAQ